MSNIANIYAHGNASGLGAHASAGAEVGVRSSHQHRQQASEFKNELNRSGQHHGANSGNGQHGNGHGVAQNFGGGYQGQGKGVAQNFGNQGNHGNQGNQGNQGNHGNQGNQGNHGNQGNQGNQGNHGNQGNQGNQQAAQPTFANGTLTDGNYSYQFSGSSLTMTNGANGEKTTVSGDPHITNPDGSQSTMNGNFTFNVGNGAKVTVLTSNGTQPGATLQQGIVAQNSTATGVVVDDGRYTSTLNSDGTANTVRGNNDPAAQQGGQLVEQNSKWVQAGVAQG